VKAFGAYMLDALEQLLDSVQVCAHKKYRIKYDCGDVDPAS